MCLKLTGGLALKFWKFLSPLLNAIFHPGNAALSDWIQEAVRMFSAATVDQLTIGSDWQVPYKDLGCNLGRKKLIPW
jgi:hypothetical protein